MAAAQKPRWAKIKGAKATTTPAKKKGKGKERAADVRFRAVSGGIPGIGAGPTGKLCPTSA